MRARAAGWIDAPVAWAALILAIALLVDLGDLRHPSGALWDESYYLTTTQRYLEGRAQYASHPPLGLMLIAGGARLIGGNDPAATHMMVALKTVAGDQIPKDYDFFGIRFASALCGALACVAFFAMMLSWTRRPRLAALATVPILFDNALIVQFRSAQLDGPQVLFSVMAIWAFLEALRHRRGAHVAFGICVGLSAMVRLNGALLGLLGIAILWADLHRDGWKGRRLGDAAAMALPFVATVAAVMLVHVAVSPHLPVFDEAGSKDLLYMTPRYRAWLGGEGHLTPAVVGDAIAGYWRFMMADLAGMARSDANGSSPMLWPLGRKTITYRWAAGHGRASYVQMAPNILGWWIAAAAVVAALAAPAIRSLRGGRRQGRPVDAATTALALWYVAFLLVNGALAQTRVMYIYHYFMALVAAYTVLALLIVRWLDRDAASAAARGRIAVAGGAALICIYVLMFPLTYNVRLGDAACAAYNAVIPIVTCVGT